MERRQHYRVQAAFAENVGIQLLLDGQVHPVRAKDLSAGGMGVLVPIAVAEPISVGTETELTFQAPWARVLILKADIIRKKKFDETHLELGLVFTEWEPRRESLGHRLRRIFNERRVLRINTPTFESPRTLISLGTGESERLIVEDVGVYGARVVASPESSIRLDQLGSFTMNFGRRNLALPCCVRHIQDGDSETLRSFGIHFHTLENMDKKIENILIDYIFELQRSEMQGPK